MVQPKSWATVWSWRTFSILSGVNSSPSHSNPGCAIREPAGTPSLYFPVNNPLASGLHIVVPRP